MDPRLQKIKQEADRIQASVNTLKDAQKSGLKVDSKTTVEQAQAFLNTKKNTPVETPVTTPDGAVTGTDLGSGTPANMPAPTATDKQAGFQTGLQLDITNAKSALDTTLKTERDAALKRQQDLNSKLERLQEKSDPTKRKTYNQEQRIIQNQLNASETASASLEEDFNSRRRIVGELETLLTQGNQAIETARRRPVALSALNQSVANTAQLVQARAGVLNAVVSGLDGNITAAHSIINNASDAVASVWNDQLAYNNAYLKLVEDGQLAVNKVHDSYAQAQVTLAEKKLNQLEETKKYLTDKMIDPESAKFIADAGVTLNDSVDEINEKLAKQSRIKERNDIKNELLLEGYEYVPFAGDREDVVTLDIAGEKMSFVPPPEPVKTSGGSSPSDRFSFKASATDVKGLQGAGFTPSDIQELEETINLYGIEATLSAMTNERQKQAVAKVFGAEETLASIEAGPISLEQAITDILDALDDTQLKNLKSKADAAKVSSWWTGKKTDVKRFLNTPEIQQGIQNALDKGLTTDEIIEALTR